MTRQQRYYIKNKKASIARAVEWNRKNRKRRRSILLKLKYKLTQVIYSAMFKRQRGCCGRCGKKHRGQKPMHVDHDHETGKVRSLLCHGCNIRIRSLSRMTAAVKKLKSRLALYEGDIQYITEHL